MGVVARAHDPSKETTAMGWKKDTSKKRIERLAESIGEIEIGELTREMNLANVKLRKPKRIRGVHLYLQPTNEKQLIEELLSCEDVDAAKAILRRVHLFERETGRIIRDFDAAQIHFQGIRLHALTYRPVGDQGQVVARAVLMAAAIDLAARKALTEAFPDDRALVCAAGASYGATLATKSGERGDSELLFLGDAANQGAKILDPSCRLRVTKDLRDLLDDGELGVTVSDLEDGTFKLTLDREAIEDGAARHGIPWTLKLSTKRVLADADAIGLDAVKVSKATTEIDKDALGLSNSKLNEAVSAFADVDGFTGIVEQATTNARRAELVKGFHIVRYELNYVRKDDYPGTLRVQYQGDRIQTLRHLPHDDPAARAMRALEVAAGWQSSIRETLPGVIGLDELRLAIGLAAGPTLVSKLGTRGNRDVLALGSGVRRAERIQRNIDGDELGVDGAVHDELPEDVAALFDWRAGAQGYVTEDLRVNQLALAQQAASLAGGDRQRVRESDGKYRIGAAAATVGLGLAAGALAARRSAARETDVAPRRRWAS